MTSRLMDSDAMAANDMADTEARTSTTTQPTTETTTQATGRTDARPPFRIHLGRDRHFEADYRQTAIAAGVLGLGVLAYKGIGAILSKGAKKSAIAPGHDGQVAPVPMAETITPLTPTPTAPAPATLVGTDTGAEFVGEPASIQPDAPFVAASGDDDTAGLLVEVTEIDIVTITPTGTPTGAFSTDQATGGTDRSALTPEHVPTDLMGDTPPTANDRAIDAFRPDPTAPVPPEMRDSLRPATGSATGFAGNRGDFAQGLSQADGSK